VTELFKSRVGFKDERISYLSGSGIPGTTSDTDNAGIGSRYVDVATATEYIKDASGSGTDKWSVSAGGGGGGGATSTILATYTAGEVLSGHIGVVYLTGKVYKFDNTNSNHFGNVVGITTQSAAGDGSSVDVITYGSLSNTGGWTLTNGPVWLSSVGAVTSTAPTTGISQQIGYATGVDSIVVDKTISIMLQ